MLYYGSRISENITKTPEGFLICMNVPINRTGHQTYLGKELMLDEDTSNNPNKEVDIVRDEEDVFDRATLASFEGKPIVNEHPDEDVDVNNYNMYANGHCQNVRRDGEYTIADLYITEPNLIRDIENGKREISCGYTCDFVPNGDGTYKQVNIRGNHIAVVNSGRAGEKVRINDSKQGFDFIYKQLQNIVSHKGNKSLMKTQFKDWWNKITLNKNLSYEEKEKLHTVISNALTDLNLRDSAIRGDYMQINDSSKEYNDLERRILNTYSEDKLEDYLYEAENLMKMGKLSRDEYKRLEKKAEYNMIHDTKVEDKKMIPNDTRALQRYIENKYNVKLNNFKHIANYNFSGITKDKDGNIVEYEVTTTPDIDEKYITIDSIYASLYDKNKNFIRSKRMNDFLYIKDSAYEDFMRKINAAQSLRELTQIRKEVEKLHKLNRMTDEDYVDIKDELRRRGVRDTSYEKELRNIKDNEVEDESFSDYSQELVTQIGKGDKSKLHEIWRRAQSDKELSQKGKDKIYKTYQAMLRNIGLKGHNYEKELRNIKDNNYKTKLQRIKDVRSVKDVSSTYDMFHQMISVIENADLKRVKVLKENNHANYKKERDELKKEVEKFTKDINKDTSLTHDEKDKLIGSLNNIKRQL